MPMMMDDLDDLFGDTQPIQIPYSHPKGLLQCVDDSHLSGCCQYVFGNQTLFIHNLLKVC